MGAMFFIAVNDFNQVIAIHVKVMPTTARNNNKIVNMMPISTQLSVKISDSIKPGELGLTEELSRPSRS